MKTNKLPKVLSFFVVMVLSLAATTASASAFFPSVKSSDKNLVLTMPQRIVKNKPLSIIAESATRGPLGGAVSEITYTWKVDVCGHKKTESKRLSTDPAAFRHSINGVFKNGCKVEVNLDTAVHYAPVGNEMGDIVVTPSRINGVLTLTDDIKLSGSKRVKVGKTGVYKAEYEADSNQKPVWFAGYSCNVMKIGFNPELYPYIATTFHWEPKKVEKCNAEALAVYTTTNADGRVSNIEYAVKKLPISSYK